MRATSLDIFCIIGFYLGLPFGWLFAEIIPGYWLIYFGLMAWYVPVSVQKYRRHKKRNRNFYTYKLDEEDKAA